MLDRAGYWLLRRWRRARVYLVPLVLGAAICLPALFGEKWISDSSFYTAISLKAVREGHWWTLHMSSGPYFNKPPLAFWLHALSMKLFGVHPWSIKLPEYAAVLACIGLTVRLTRLFAPAKAAMLAGVILACTTQFVLLVDSYRLDYIHTALILWAVVCVAVGYKRAQVHRSGAGLMLLASGVPVGLAMLTKPIWGAVVLLVLAAWLGATGVVERNARRLVLWMPGAMLVAAAVAVPWHWSMISLHGEEFVNTYFRSQTLARARGDDFGVEPWWWYFDHLWRHSLPIVLLTICAFGMILRGPIARLVRASTGRRVHVKRLTRDPAGTLLAAGWVVVMIALLTAFPDKKRYYIYHVYPFMAWMGGAWLARILPRVVRTGIDRGAPWVAATLLAAAVAVVPSAVTRMHPTADLWKRTYAWINRNRADVERSGLYNASLLYNEAARVYVFTGVWPLAGDWNNERPIEPPPGSLVMYDAENPFHTWRKPRPSDEVLFTADRVTIVRRK